MDKGMLEYRGETFLDRIRMQLLALNLPCVISTADREQGPEDGAVYVRDIPKQPGGSGVGPMGGIWSCFQQTDAEGFFTVSCDMPLFRREMFQALMDRWQPEYDALVWRTRDGRIHPVCGYYSRSCEPALKKAIESGNYRMMKVLSDLNCLFVDTSEVHLPDTWFANVNSPQALEQLKERPTPALAVSGRKNTGKTTLLEGLVKSLSSAGIRTAVIKHDGHEFESDVPGADSRRLKEAGAYGAVVYSATKFALVKEERGLEARDFFSCFPEADIILLEGQKDSDYPKLETVRKEISLVPVCRPETVLAYVSDGDVDQTSGKAETAGGALGHRKPVYSYEDTHRLTELVVEAMDGYI